MRRGLQEESSVIASISITHFLGKLEECYKDVPCFP